MAASRRIPARSVRPSTRAQTRKVLRSSTKPKPVKSLKPVPAVNRSTRVLRSTSTPQSSPIPPPALPGRQSTVKPRRRGKRNDPYRPTRAIKKKARKPPAPPPTHYTCRICAEELPIASFIKRIVNKSPWPVSPEIPYQCMGHLARIPRTKKDPVCKPCIGQAMAARHSLVGARKVSAGCLEPGCEVFWGHQYIVKYFPAGEQLEQYNTDMLQVFLTDSLILTCINPACASRGLVDPVAPGYPQIQCHNSDCATRFCAACLVPWHEGQTCAEYAARHINAAMTDLEKETLQLMQTKNGKRCPNCFIVVEKDGGCNSMWCTGCNKYFDWGTAASAVPGSKRVVMDGDWDNFDQGPVVCEQDGLEGKGIQTEAEEAASAVAAVV